MLFLCLRDFARTITPSRTVGLKYRAYCFAPCFMKQILPFILVLSCAPVWAQTPLAVKVVDASGAPVAGAVVHVRVWSPKALAPVPIKVTDAAGAVRFSLPAVPGEKLSIGTVTVGAKGFAFNATVARDGKAEVKLERGASWRGKVLDGAGNPLAGATVWLRGAMRDRDFGTMLHLPDAEETTSPPNPLLALYTTTTKADGSFEIANAPADRELLFGVKSAGYSLAIGQKAQAGDEQEVRLARAGSVHGRALGPDGKPLANLKIYASTLNGMGNGNSATTKADGSFTIANLSAGAYRLVASPPENAPYILARRAEVRVDASKTSEIGLWRAQKGVVIRGMARDAVSKKPVAGASFDAEGRAGSAQNTSTAWTTSDANGRFALRVLPGSYQVRSSGAPRGYLAQSTPKNVEVGAQGGEVNFLLKAAPLIRGIALDERGQPIKARITIGWGAIITSDDKGKWEYSPQRPETLGFAGSTDDSGYFEVVSPRQVEWPVSGPVTVTVRHKPWDSVSGRVVNSEGSPVEGVRVEGEILVRRGGDSWTTDNVSATTDKDGRYTLTRLRGTFELKVAGKKNGFEFQSGGKVSRKDDAVSVSDLVFVPLGGAIEGTTQAGAQLVVAGRETRADASGHFKFAALPSGQNTVFAAKDNAFGSAPGAAKLDIKLQPLLPQGQDKAFAEQLWAQLKQPTGQRALKTLQEWQTPPNFEADMKAALAAGDINTIENIAERWKKGDSLESLRAGIDALKPPERHADALLKAALATKDRKMMEQALEESEATFKGQTTSLYWREPQLYMSAVLRERLNGAEDGQLAINRALAYTQQNHPEKSRVEAAVQTQVGRNQALSDYAKIAAQGSPALLRSVLDFIDDGSAYTIKALAEAIPVVVKTHGLAAATPLLVELKTTPVPTGDLEQNYVVFNPAWAYGQAVQEIIPLIGAQNPAKALELAKQVAVSDQGPEQRARALASAAQYQTPAIAAPIYREAVKLIDAHSAPRIAALVWERDPKLGAELFAVARQKAEDEANGDMHWRNAWAPFAFYYARVNPAQSRLILEREWSKSLRERADADQLTALVAAMAAVDAHRALEMAQSMPKNGDNDWGPDLRIRIARYVFADDALRRQLALNISGYQEAWNSGPVKW
ncbi:hypothetical protein EON83_20760 [bacterium]|nr:MAG: hypothetical protein EON83_20760 [bacterium]